MVERRLRTGSERRNSLAKPRETFIERTENKNLNVHAQLDRLEVLTDKQIDELLVIVEDKRKALLEGDG
jgi:hypothetical protein